MDHLVHLRGRIKCCQVSVFNLGRSPILLEGVLLSEGNISSLNDNTKGTQVTCQLPAQLSSTIFAIIFSVLFVISALTSAPIYLPGK